MLVSLDGCIGDSPYLCIIFHSNESMYDVGEYYSGTNSTFTVNVYYILNFDTILRSYGMCVGGVLNIEKSSRTYIEG